MHGDEYVSGRDMGMRLRDMGSGMGVGIGDIEID